MNASDLHSLVWRRFVRLPYAHVLDCADEAGNAVIPTGDECRAGLPTVVGWTTPIADCAFFSGLYLYGLCRRYESRPDAQTERELALLADGLCLLCEIGEKDGFIARGVADDGYSHYPCSSEDQFGPWLLGLWRYLHTDACTASRRDRILPLIRRTLSGVIGAGWEIPSELEGQTCGSLRGPEWRCSAKLVFAAAVARELGILSGDEYLALLAAIPEGSIYSRLSLLSAGFANDMVRSPNLIQFWIYTCGHLCMGELCSLDPENAPVFRAAMRANGRTVSRLLRDYETYMAMKKPPFLHDWRVLLPEVRETATFAARFAEAGRLNGLWAGKYNPVRNAERGPLAQSVFGIWIALTSGEEAARTLAASCLADAAERVDWANVGHAYPFVLECAMYAGQS